MSEQEEIIKEFDEVVKGKKKTFELDKGHDEPVYGKKKRDRK